MKKTTLLILTLFFSCNFIYASDFNKKKNKFSFAFFTDIHLNKGDNNCFQGIEKAIESAKMHNIDFILTGGDNVDIDVLGEDAKTAHELYKQYANVIANSNIDYYATVGSHDPFFGCEKSNPLYNEGMFEKYISEHSEAEFSHGICPECFQEHHPDAYELDENTCDGGQTS